VSERRHTASLRWLIGIGAMAHRVGTAAHLVGGMAHRIAAMEQGIHAMGDAIDELEDPAAETGCAIGATAAPPRAAP